MIDTEIDWKAYMEEVAGYLQGETNYMNLKGATGPLVYPAGFVYIFSGFYYITSEGTNIFLGIRTLSILLLYYQYYYYTINTTIILSLLILYYHYNQYYYTINATINATIKSINTMNLIINMSS
jgi:alpha-1,3-mannosyltransferase